MGVVVGADEERLAGMQWEGEAVVVVSPVCRVGRELLRQVAVFSMVLGTGVGGRLMVLKAAGGLAG